MIKAVLFDMDGVIVNTEPLHRKAYFKAFEDVGIDVSDAYYHQFIGQSTMEICKTVCKDFQLDCTPETILNLKRKHFKTYFDTDGDLELIDGVLPLIKDYYSNGLTLVLASSASMLNINRIFDRFELNPYFKAKISGADLKASKPHPEIFIKAAELAEVPKAACMVIEDSTNGMKAAKEAGIFCVGFKGPQAAGQNYDLANVVVQDFEAISFAKLERIFSK